MRKNKIQVRGSVRRTLDNAVDTFKVKLNWFDGDTKILATDDDFIFILEGGKGNIFDKLKYIMNNNKDVTGLKIIKFYNEI